MEVVKMKIKEAVNRIDVLLNNINIMKGDELNCDSLTKFINWDSISNKDYISIDDRIIEYLEKLLEDDVFMKKISASCDLRKYEGIYNKMQEQKEQEEKGEENV
tara:strand:- start:126 stop:437 length:312 start_codon:yes stop_codon:yes gene_type:complete